MFSCCILTALTVYVSPQDSDRPDGLLVAREASRAASQKLSSGSGVGTYSYYTQQIGEAVPTLAAKANFRVYFRERKYQLQLDFVHESPRFDRQIITYDGTAVFNTMF